MKTITVYDFWTMTGKQKKAFIKKHLGLEVGCGFRICGYDNLSIIVGNTSAETLNTDTAWPCEELNLSWNNNVKILTMYPFFLFATVAALAAINKANETSTSKND